jgi:hypothetical protein
MIFEKLKDKKRINRVNELLSETLKKFVKILEMY